MLFSARCSSRHFPEKGLYCSRRPCSNKRPPQISAHLLGLNVKQAPPPPSNNHPLPHFLKVVICFYCQFIYNFITFNFNFRIEKGELFLSCSSYSYLHVLAEFLFSALLVNGVNLPGMFTIM